MAVRRSLESPQNVRETVRPGPVGPVNAGEGRLVSTIMNSVAAHSSAGALRLEPEYAAKSPVHLVHEGRRRVADGFFKVCLIEGDEGGDVDD